MDEKQPLVSVIVPTRNSAAYLGACLKSVREQDYPRVELIVVDNNSTDGTKKISENFTQKVFNQGPERSTQRNRGARESRGAYLLFIDSDMVLGRAVLREAVRAISAAPAIKQVIIPEQSVGEGFWAEVKAYERSFYIGDDTMEAARFFERGTFFRFKGYNEKIRGGGEEYDLPERILEAGFKQARIKVFIQHHEGHLTLGETMRTKYYYGQTASHYVKRHPEKARGKLQILRAAHRRGWRRLLRHPFLTSAMIWLRTCEISAGALGYMKSRLKPVKK